jgi:hypothetical protein
MYDLPEPKPTAPAAGQATNPLADAVIQAAIDNAIHEARRLDTAPARKPERPAMSSKATDDSVRMLCFGGMTLLTCGGVSLVMVASEAADPTAIGMFFGGGAVLALAIARLLRRAGQVVPPEIHNHYSGTVHQDQRHTHTSTRGVWVNTNNQQ